MIEVVGNLWTYPADVRVITTNGSVRQDGMAVMGRGCALEATKLFPDLQADLGEALEGGNRCYLLGNTYTGHGTSFILMTFPVKHKWMERADLALIRKSALELVIYANNDPTWKVIVLPRPGCGNGRLSWPNVKEILEPILDDRFRVITFGR